MKKLLLLTLVLLWLPAALAADESEPLRLAMSGAFQPFSTTDAEGKLVGFDADIARALARRLGRPAQLMQTDWAGIQAGLQAGKFDLICGSMAITAERMQSMQFSLPYYVSGAQVFAPGNGPPRRIGVTEDSTYANYIKEHPHQFPEAEVVHYGSEAEIVAALHADKVDGFVSDRIVGGFYLTKGGAGEVKPQGDLLYQEACGIAARPGDVELVRQANHALLAMVQEGEYSVIYERWVGSPPDLGLLLGSWGDYAEHLPAAAQSSTTDKNVAFADRAGSMMGLLAEGAILTIELSFLTALLALFTGALVGLGTAARAPLIKAVALAYIGLVRGTPLLVQLFVFYFVIATAINRVVGAELVGPFGAALLALVFNTTAYNAETLRGGILAVDRGQWDAAASLGMQRAQILRRIVLPQALRDSLPSLGNNLVVLIKDTSLVGAITLIELTYAARNVVFQTGQAFLPFFLAAGFYLVIITGVSFAMGRWEKHLTRSRGTA